jgi:hypothetical protein
MIDTDRIPALPGKPAEVWYRDGRGWVRPI